MKDDMDYRQAIPAKATSDQSQSVPAGCMWEVILSNHGREFREVLKSPKVTKFWSISFYNKG